MMKRLLIIVLVSWAGLVQAEDIVASVDTMSVDTLSIDTLPRVALITDSMPNVVIIQDLAIRQLLYEKALGISTKEEVAGYRVQIYSSNRQQVAKNEAIALEQNIASQIDQPIYVSYISPFWKVRIGDFLTYEEASEYKRIFVTQHPELLGDTYVVRDQVKTRR